MFQALKAKAAGKQASSIQFDIKIHDAASLPVPAGTLVYAQWKRKNKVQTQHVVVGEGGTASFEETLVDVGSMMKQPGSDTFDDKVGELSVCASSLGMLGSVELNLSEYASPNPGGVQKSFQVKIRSKKSPAGQLNVTISSLLASLADAVKNTSAPAGPTATSGRRGSARELDELHLQVEELQDELDEETAHSEAMSAEVQRLLVVIQDLESQLLDSDGAMLAAEERKSSGLRLMAKIVQNSISDQAKWGFTTWRLWILSHRDERNSEYSAARCEALVQELASVKEEASAQKANVALKKIIYAAQARGFASWKDVMMVQKKLRELGALSGQQQLRDMKEPFQKLQFVLNLWGNKEVAAALSNWKRSSKASMIRELLVAEQWFARNEICDQRYRVIVRQWKHTEQARAVSNWWQNVMGNRVARAASTGLSGKNKHNYEVLCKRILKLDNTIFNNNVASIALWYRSELRRNFSIWKSIYMSRSHRVWEMRSGLQVLRTKAAGSFVKILESFACKVRTGALQKAWGLWRTFLVENMMTMHQAMVEKLWSRNQAQAAELEAMRQEVQFGRSIGSAMEENVELKKENRMLAERNSQILTHSDEMVGGVQQTMEALRAELDEWKNKALLHEAECAGLQEATLEEQSDFLELFAKLAERCVMERENCLRTVVGIYSRYAISESFLHWAKMTGQRQLSESLQLVDAANSQLRGVIAKVSGDQSQLPKLQLELEASNRDRAELRATVERNMQYTQALISNLNFLKSALPAHVAAQVPNPPPDYDTSANSRRSQPSQPSMSKSGTPSTAPSESRSPSASLPPVSLEDLLQPDFAQKSYLRRSRRH